MAWTVDTIKTPPPLSSEKLIIALGDSLTAGLGLPEDQSYPAQLEVKLQSLGYHYRVQNAWVSWDTSAGLLARMDWILTDVTPDLVILCIGANDAFQGKWISDIEQNIRTMIERLQSKKISILLAGMRAPYNLGKEYRDQYDTLFAKLAAEYHLWFLPFLLEGVALDPKLNQPDKIHPTKEGYTIIVSNIISHLEHESLIKK